METIQLKEHEKKVYNYFSNIISEDLNLMPIGTVMMRRDGDAKDLSSRKLYRVGRFFEGLKTIEILEEYLGWKFKDQRVLDLACGFGGYVAALSTRELLCIGTDFIDYNFGKLQPSLKKAGFNSTTAFVVSDMNSLPFRAGKFDIIFSNYGFEHVPNIQSHLTKLSCLLKKNGFLVVGLPVVLKEIIKDSHFALPLVAVLPARLRTIVAERFFRRRYPWRIYLTFYRFHFLKTTCAKLGLKAKPLIFEHTRKYKIIHHLPLAGIWLRLIEEFYWDLTVIQKHIRQDSY